MNKHTFLLTLRRELVSLPEAELNELLGDYEAHFTFGLQSGKTEEEIAQELGNPQEIAREAFGETSFLRSNDRKTESMTRTIFSVAGLLFLNLMFMIPITAAIWAVWIALCVSAIAGMVSPLLAVAEFLMLSSYSGMLLFLSIALCGLGIFLAMAAYYLGKALARVTVVYIRWNYRVMKGES